jgi:hypothetical protein
MSYCQVCQQYAPTRQVTFLQNIGMLVAFRWSKASGMMCRTCGERTFKEMTTITAIFGWWGIISFFLTPIFLVVNLIGYSQIKSLPYPDASAPVAQDWIASPTGAVPVAMAMPVAAPPKSKTASLSNWALGLSVVGLLCVPLAPLASLICVWRARAASSKDDPLPTRAWVATGLAAFSLLVFGYGLYAMGEDGRQREARLAELKPMLEGATAAELQKELACALVESQVLHGLHEGKKYAESVKCEGALTSTGAAAELESVSATFNGKQVDLGKACLRRDERWFVLNVGTCEGGELSAKAQGLSLDQQEDAWREEEKSRAAKVRNERVQQRLTALLETDVEGVASCEAKHLEVSGVGDALFDLVTIDTGPDGPTGKSRWDFLTSYDVRQFLANDSYSRDGAGERLDRVRYVGLIRPVGIREPEIVQEGGKTSYEGGLFVGTLVLADIATGKALCETALVFGSSDTVSVRGSRYAAASKHKIEEELDSDLMRQFRRALSDVFDDVRSGKTEVAAHEEEPQVQPASHRKGKAKSKK